MCNLFYTFTHYNMTYIFNIHNMLLCGFYINVHNLATSLGRIICMYQRVRIFPTKHCTFFFVTTHRPQDSTLAHSTSEN